MADAKHVVLIHGAWGRGEQLAAAGASFEDRGYTVHTPTLRHHELPPDEGATKIASLSIRDYADDLVAFVNSLDSAPLLVGHSLGGLLAQMVAARTRPAGVVAACSGSVAGVVGATPLAVRIAIPHLLQPRPWVKPLRPPTFERFRRWYADTQIDDTARELYDGLAPESGRFVWEVLLGSMMLSKATVVDFTAVTAPVLVIRGEYDRVVSARNVCQTAARYRYGAHVEIPGADHFIFHGNALPVTMGHIDDWMAKNHVLTNG